MMSLHKITHLYTGLRYTYKSAIGITVRTYNERKGDKKPKVVSKTSASVQLAKGVARESTMQESPEAKLRVIKLDSVRPKISELDQRKLRHRENDQFIKELKAKQGTYTIMEPKLPFIKPASPKQTIRSCSTVEEVLQLSNDPQQLARELVELTKELSTEKRKNDEVVERYLTLKEQLLNAKIKGN